MRSKLIPRFAVGALLLSTAPSAVTVGEVTQILGRPTDRSVTLSLLAPDPVEAFVEFGTRPGVYTGRTAAARTSADQPFEYLLDGLQPDTRYFYRVRYARENAKSSFHTQRAPGATFTFGVQGDSHPERLGRMYWPELYQRTLDIVRRDRPDFYVLLG